MIPETIKPVSVCQIPRKRNCLDNKGEGQSKKSQRLFDGDESEAFADKPGFLNDVSEYGIGRGSVHEPEENSSPEQCAMYGTPDESFGESVEDSPPRPVGMSDAELLRQQLTLIKEAKKLGLVVVEKSELDDMVGERERLRAHRKKMKKKMKRLTTELAEVRSLLEQLKRGQAGASITDEKRQRFEKEKEDEDKDGEYEEDETTLAEDTQAISDTVSSPCDERSLAISPKNQKEIVQVVEHLRGLSLDLEHLMIDNGGPEQSASAPQPETNVSRAKVLQALTTAISELEIEVLESENLLKHGSEWTRRE